MDISTNYVGYIERGERTVSLQVLERLARVLGVEASTFFLFHERGLDRTPKPPDHKSQLMTKLATVLQHAETEDLTFLFKLAKRLARTTRS